MLRILWLSYQWTSNIIVPTELLIFCYLYYFFVNFIFYFQHVLTDLCSHLIPRAGIWVILFRCQLTLLLVCLLWSRLRSFIQLPLLGMLFRFPLPLSFGTGLSLLPPQSFQSRRADSVWAGATTAPESLVMVEIFLL